jgi:RNA-directed DNA polymerase
MSEIPVHSRPRRLADWINPTGAKKVHSLIDKVYQRKNLEMAWETVKANRGSGGVDGQSLDGFAAQLGQQLDRLRSELKEDVYRPQPVRQAHLPRGRPRRRESQESFARWESRLYMTGYASRRCSIG